MNPYRVFQPESAPDPGAPTVRHILDAFLLDQKSELTPGTLADSRRIGERFAAACSLRCSSTFGDRTPADIHPSEVKAWILSCAEWKAANTRWGVLNKLKRLFNWAANDRWIRPQDNPVHGLTLPKGGRRDSTTELQFQTMLRCSRAYFRRALIFMRATGCRPENMRAVEWEWVRWQGRYIEIPWDRHKTGRKTKRPAYVKLGRVAMKLLIWMRTRCAGTGAIFTNARGQAWTRIALAKQLLAMRERSQLRSDLFGPCPVGEPLTRKATLHGIRHLFGTTCGRRGAPLKLISEMMNHRDSGVTEEFYLHIGEDLDFSEILDVADLGAARDLNRARKNPGT